MRMTITNGLGPSKICDLSQTCGEFGVIIQNITGNNAQFSTNNPALASATIDPVTGFLTEGFTLPDPKGFFTTIKLLPFADTLYCAVAKGQVDQIIDVMIVRIGKSPA